MRRLVVLMLAASCFAVSATPVSAGSKDGPRRWTRKMKKNTEIVYKIVFKANEPAEFAFIGDGRNDLDLYITDSSKRAVKGGFDAKGRPTVSGRDYFTSDIGLVRWVPTKTQTFNFPPADFCFEVKS